DIDGTEVTVCATGADPGDDLSVARVIAAVVWSADPDERPIRIRAGDDTARAALERWSLLPVGID
ncbi:MAG: HAD family hydrolase, partial [Mycobacterium sp.]|nr:HAD family hydrolase [Mycobacterium sp.]